MFQSTRSSFSIMGTGTGIRASWFQDIKALVFFISCFFFFFPTTVHPSQYHCYAFSKYFFGPGNCKVAFQCEELTVPKGMKILKSTEWSLSKTKQNKKNPQQLQKKMSHLYSTVQFWKKLIKSKQDRELQIFFNGFILIKSKKYTVSYWDF